MGAVLGHGFHPLKARQSRSIPNLQTVHRQGRIPAWRHSMSIHVCPGGDVDSVHSADVPYEELLKHLFKLNAGYFQLQMASERDRESAYKLVGKYLRDDAKGVT